MKIRDEFADTEYEHTMLDRLAPAMHDIAKQGAIWPFWQNTNGSIEKRVLIESLHFAIDGEDDMTDADQDVARALIDKIAQARPEQPTYLTVAEQHTLLAAVTEYHEYAVTMQSVDDEYDVEEIEARFALHFIPGGR